ncbi:MAG: prephenate dehydrogenase [Elusimicrobia bacterium]|jgi:prephenate dehydrogenase|nr:prephenate dehydrogenase [Elusimicrobiota bacterium]
MIFKKAAIAGVGLIGGAMGMDLREKKLAGAVTGWGRNLKKLQKAVELGACDEITLNCREAVGGADLVVLATPPAIILRQLKEILPYLKKDAVVIDVGSIKKPIVQAAELDGFRERGVEFVGCHPMAGSDKTGVQNASLGFFAGEPCIITPYKNSEEVTDKIINLWKELGSKVSVMEPAAHDEAVGVLSHLPHVLATALINTVKCYIESPLKASGLSGASLTDMTRVAMASPDLWYDIYDGNKTNLIKALKETETKLSQFRKALKKGNKTKIINIMNEAKKFREEL